MRAWRKKHPEQRQKAREKGREIKQEVLTHYGNNKCCCVQCDENRLACLSIDHINGGGNKERNKLRKRSSYLYYTWLKKNNYPEGYQTLCMNCQFVKRFQFGEHDR